MPPSLLDVLAIASSAARIAKRSAAIQARLWAERSHRIEAASLDPPDAPSRLPGEGPLLGSPHDQRRHVEASTFDTSEPDVLDVDIAALAREELPSRSLPADHHAESSPPTTIGHSAPSTDAEETHSPRDAASQELSALFDSSFTCSSLSPATAQPHRYSLLQSGFPHQRRSVISTRFCYFLTPQGSLKSY
jgi:hypothetical protein